MTKYEFIFSAFKVEGLFDLVNPPLDIQKFCEIVSLEKYCIHKQLGISTSTSCKIVNKLFPEKPKKNTKVCTYLMTKYDMAYCVACHQVKSNKLFSKNSSKPSGYNNLCKECYKAITRDYHREYQAKRKILKISRMPSWANQDKIKDIYASCPENFHVDHIVPLKGKNVCGLHVEANLQHLPSEENLKKKNKFNDWDVN